MLRSLQKSRTVELLAPWRSLVFAVVLACASAIAVHGQEGSIGTERWRVRLFGWVEYSSPALSLDGSAIYIGMYRDGGGGRLEAITPNQSTKWRVDFSEGIEASPSVGPDGTVYIGCLNGIMYAFYPNLPANALFRDRLKWSYTTGGPIGGSAALSADGSTLYVGSEDGYLYALDASNGSLRWRMPTGREILASPVVGPDGSIYIGSLDGKFYAFNPDGSQKWAPKQTGGAIYGSAAIGRDGTLYFGSHDQSVYAIAPDGTTLWEFFTNGAIDVSPALGADGTVYVMSADRNFYALDPSPASATRRKWATPMGVSSASSPAVRSDGVILFGADDNRVHGLRPDGSKLIPFNLGKTDADDAITSSPLVTPDGAIYIASVNGAFLRLDTNGAPLSTVSSWPSFQRTPMRSGYAELSSTAGRLINLSTRASVASGAAPTLIVGFVVQSAQSRLHLIRAIGPTLQSFGVSGFMPNPRLQAFVDNGTTSVPIVNAANDDWTPNSPDGFPIAETTAAVGGFPLPQGSRDAVLLPILPGGLYTAHAKSADGVGGVVLVEVYETKVPDVPSRLINLSTRTQVGVGENELIAGFVVGGAGPSRLLVRAVGPGLAPFGVSGLLAQPVLSLRSRFSDIIQRNQGWTTGTNTADLRGAAGLVGAFSLEPADCAMVVTLAPGEYTAQVSGVAGSTGEALVEIYVLP